MTDNVLANFVCYKPSYKVFYNLFQAMRGGGGGGRHFFSSSKKLSQFPRYGVGLASYMTTNVCDKQASKKKQKHLEPKGVFESP